MRTTTILFKVLLTSWLIYASCSKPSDDSSRILAMTVKSKPDYVQRLVDASGKTICTVTFIDEYTALTAAHCLMDTDLEIPQFNPSHRIRVSFDSESPEKKDYPIVAACFHPEFPKYMKEAKNITKETAHINPVTLAPFDFAIIHLGGNFCQQCDERESIQKLGTSLNEIATKDLAISDAEYKKIRAKFGNVAPATLLEYLELEKRTEKSNYKSLTELLASNFTDYVTGANITGVGTVDTLILNGNYRLGYVNNDSFRYQHSFGSTISKIDANTSEKPETRKGDSGSALHFSVDDANSKFFGTLNIPPPEENNIFAPGPGSMIARGRRLFDVFGGVNSGLSKEYGVYSVPQSIFNQVILQSLVWKDQTDKKTWKKANGEAVERLASKIKTPLIDATGYTYVEQTYFCNIAHDTKQIAAIQKAIQEGTGGGVPASDTGQGPFLTTSNPTDYIGTFLENIKLLMDDKNYPQYSPSVNGTLNHNQALDFMMLVSHQTRLRRNIAAIMNEMKNDSAVSNSPNEQHRLRQNKDQLLDWTSDDAIINTYEFQPEDLAGARLRTAGALFNMFFDGRSCTGSILDVSPLLDIENNHIYGMMPLHCLGTNFQSKEDALQKLNELCSTENALRLLLPASGKKTLLCRGPQDNAQLARFPAGIYGSSFNNAQNDIFLFPLSEDLYAELALKADISTEGNNRNLNHGSYEFLGSTSNRQAVTIVGSPQAYGVSEAFVSDRINGPDTDKLMIHDFKTNTSYSGSVVVGLNTDESSSDLVCMHLGERTESDDAILLSSGKRSSGNRCVHMSILRDIFADKDEADVPFESPAAMSRSAAQSLPEAIAEVATTAPSAQVAINNPVAPAVEVMPEGIDVVPAQPLGSTSGGSGGSAAQSLSCDQCTIDSDCFCCSNSAGMSCNLRATFPTAGKDLSSIAKIGQIAHTPASNAKIYRIIERTRTDSLYPVWFKIRYEEQDAWVWSGQ